MYASGFYCPKDNTGTLGSTTEAKTWTFVSYASALSSSQACGAERLGSFLDTFVRVSQCDFLYPRPAIRTHEVSSAHGSVPPVEGKVVSGDNRRSGSFSAVLAGDVRESSDAEGVAVTRCDRSNALRGTVVDGFGLFVDRKDVRVAPRFEGANTGSLDGRLSCSIFFAGNPLRGSAELELWASRSSLRDALD